MPHDRQLRTLVLCLADPSGNPRPNRIIRLCKEIGHHVSVASLRLKAPMPHDVLYEFSAPSMAMAARIGRKILMLASAIIPLLKDIVDDCRFGLSRLRKVLKNQEYDYIVVEDFDLLKFAFSLKKNAKIIFDAREYYPKEFEGNMLWRWFEQPRRLRICRDYLPLCDKVMTVSPGLVDAYQKNFNIDALLIRSMPAYQDVPSLPVSDNIFKMVHHGNANRDRKLENMILMFRDLDSRFTLDFYLTGNAEYIGQLKDMAKNIPAIQFKSPVPFKEIIPMLQQYDIGLYLLEPTGFNTEYSLPNKFFEFIQARLALATGPSPDMAALLQHYECGIVSSDFHPHSMAMRLNSLDRDAIMAMKQASDKAARDLCFEKESEKIVAMFEALQPCA